MPSQRLIWLGFSPACQELADISRFRSFVERFGGCFLQSWEHAAYCRCKPRKKNGETQNGEISPADPQNGETQNGETQNGEIGPASPETANQARRIKPGQD